MPVARVALIASLVFGFRPSFLILNNFLEQSKMMKASHKRFGGFKTRIDHLCAKFEEKNDDKGILMGLSAKTSKLGDKTRPVAREQKVLSILSFQHLRLRHSDIKEAHKKTFEWIFTVPISGSTTRD